jgi:hypothetical protein
LQVSLDSRIIFPSRLLDDILLILIEEYEESNAMRQVNPDLEFSWHTTSQSLRSNFCLLRNIMHWFGLSIRSSNYVDRPSQYVFVVKSLA